MQVVCGIPLDVVEVIAVGGLLSADSCDPEFLSAEGTSEGFDFTDEAAFFTVFNGIVETIGTFLEEELFDRFCAGVVGFYGLLVSFEGTRPGGVRFLKIATCVEGKHADGQMIRKNKMANDLIFNPKTGAEHDFVRKPSR